MNICLVCADPIQLDTQALRCPQDSEHVICTLCTPNYVKHCCESDDRLPLLCAIPTCQFQYQEEQIKSLLSPEQWTVYEESMIRAALSFQGVELDDMDEKELGQRQIPLRCSLCSYHEVFVMAPMDYWTKLNKVAHVTQGIIRENLQSCLEERLYYAETKRHSQIRKIRKALLLPRSAEFTRSDVLLDAKETVQNVNELVDYMRLKLEERVQEFDYEQAEEILNSITTLKKKENNLRKKIGKKNPKYLQDDFGLDIFFDNDSCEEEQKHSNFTQDPVRTLMDQLSQCIAEEEQQFVLWDNVEEKRDDSFRNDFEQLVTELKDGIETLVRRIRDIEYTTTPDKDLVRYIRFKHYIEKMTLKRISDGCRKQLNMLQRVKFRIMDNASEDEYKKINDSIEAAESVVWEILNRPIVLSDSNLFSKYTEFTSILHNVHKEKEWFDTLDTLITVSKCRLKEIEENKENELQPYHKKLNGLYTHIGALERSLKGKHKSKKKRRKRKKKITDEPMSPDDTSLILRKQEDLRNVQEKVRILENERRQKLMDLETTIHSCHLEILQRFIDKLNSFQLTLDKKYEKLETFHDEIIYDVSIKTEECAALSVDAVVDLESVDFTRQLLEQFMGSVDIKWDVASKSLLVPFETTNYFICRRPDCTGAYCLLCRTQIDLSKIEDLEHLCGLDEVAVVYFKLLDILAKACTRTCPKCRKRGSKDDACMHIRCPRCTTDWCYFCQQVLNNIYDHYAGWDRDIRNGKCPTFCRFVYGGDQVQSVHSRYQPEPFDMDDPGAVEEFHKDLQRARVQEFASKVNPEIWQKVMETYYPSGIII